MDEEKSLADDIIEEDEQELEKNKPIRGKNKVYELIEVFDNIEEFETFWKGSEFQELYCIQERSSNSSGEYTSYRCRYNKKAGYKSLQLSISMRWRDMVPRDIPP